MSAASAHQARIESKYGSGVFRGQNLAEITTTILEKNAESLSRAVLTTDKKRLRRNLKKILPASPGRSTRINFPDVSNVVRRSKTVAKVAEQGEVITTSLRNRIQQDIKKTLIENGLSTTRGTIPKRLTSQLKARLKTTFSAYTKKDPRLGMPKNIARIAITEARSAANNIRLEYATALQAANDSFEIRKTWIHNHSRHPRGNHKRMHKRNVKLENNFKFKSAQGGVTYIAGPHDVRLGPEDTINCHCELTFRFVPRKPPRGET